MSRHFESDKITRMHTPSHPVEWWARRIPDHGHIDNYVRIVMERRDWKPTPPRATRHDDGLPF